MKTRTVTKEVNSNGSRPRSMIQCMGAVMIIKSAFGPIAPMYIIANY